MRNKYLKIDLSKPSASPAPRELRSARRSGPQESSRRSTRFRKLIGSLSISVGVLFFGVVCLALISNQSIGTTLSHLPLIGDISRLITASSFSLEGAINGRTNILLLGVGGAGHEGPDLTDTIIVVSLDHIHKRIGMISIPRDLLVAIPGHGIRKINEANSYGEAEDRGKGGELARQTVANLLDIPIHYYIRVDFAAFEESIDALGGIDLYVDHSFNDPYYPLGPNQFQTVSFSSGYHHFDGATALKYARSRYTTSDFDRAKRQQDILKAVKDRAFSLKTWLDPSRIFTIWRSVADHVDTDLSRQDIQILIGMLPEFNTDSIAQLVLTDAPDNYLFSTTTPETGFILLPRDKTFAEIKQAAQTLFADESADQPKQPSSLLPPQAAAAHQEDTPLAATPKVIIHNGTTLPGLAQKTADIINQYDFTVVTVGNAPEPHEGVTLIYDLSEGSYLEPLAFLTGLLEADIADIVPSRYLTEYASSADFYVIVGKDAE